MDRARDMVCVQLEHFLSYPLKPEEQFAATY